MYQSVDLCLFSSIFKNQSKMVYSSQACAPKRGNNLQLDFWASSKVVLCIYCNLHVSRLCPLDVNGLGPLRFGGIEEISFFRNIDLCCFRDR